VWTHHGTDLAAWKECERAAHAEQIRAGKFRAAAMPALSEADARALVRFAYFTDRPPADTAYLLSPLWGNMPPDVKVFPAGTPVTFFYGIEPTGRMLTIKTQWFGPGGAVAKTQEQSVRQLDSRGTWIWRTQRAEANLIAPGPWRVDLAIEGHLVGSYEFSVENLPR
jgi:hypothetical protein